MVGRKEKVRVEENGRVGGKKVKSSRVGVGQRGCETKQRSGDSVCGRIVGK